VDGLEAGAASAGDGDDGGDAEVMIKRIIHCIEFSEPYGREVANADNVDGSDEQKWRNETRGAVKRYGWL